MYSPAGKVYTIYTSQKDGKHIFDSQERILPLKFTFYFICPMTQNLYPYPMTPFSPSHDSVGDQSHGGGVPCTNVYSAECCMFPQSPPKSLIDDPSTQTQYPIHLNTIQKSFVSTYYTPTSLPPYLRLIYPYPLSNTSRNTNTEFFPLIFPTTRNNENRIRTTYILEKHKYFGQAF